LSGHRAAATLAALLFLTGPLQFLPCHAGLSTEPGVLAYCFGAELFYANEQRFADELRRLVDRTTPLGWIARRRTASGPRPPA
jgi:hypothetical protein